MVSIKLSNLNSSPQLRRINRIKTITGTLAIEGNTLTLDQVKAIVDANGRMGRFWQTLILGNWNKSFYSLPLESVVKEKQEGYYQAFNEADKTAESTVFIEFMLTAIEDVLKTSLLNDQATDQATDQVKKLLSVMKNDWVTRIKIMKKLGLSHIPTFRKNYLNPAIKSGLIIMKYPDSPKSPKQMYRRV